MMRQLALSALVVGMAAGCEREPPSRPQGLTPAEVQAAPRPYANAPPAPPPSAPPPPSSLPSPFATGTPDPGALVNRGAAPDVPDAGPPAAEVSKRDLGVELAQLVGQPLSCVDFAAIVAGGGKLAITVHAQVVPSGRITRADVSAPGQSETALRCIEKLVTAASLQGPVPGAPRKVTTTVTMQVVANQR